jgi:hypothetical protein
MHLNIDFQLGKSKYCNDGNRGSNDGVDDAILNHRECIRIDERNTKMMLMVINAAANL